MKVNGFQTESSKFQEPSGFLYSVVENQTDFSQKNLIMKDNFLYSAECKLCQVIIIVYGEKIVSSFGTI